jgi:rhamnose transport system permease protein
MNSISATVTAPPPTAENFFGRYQREISVLLVYLSLLLVLAVFRPAFYRAQFRATWVGAAPTLVAAVGMTLVILARQIDISVGSQFSVCGVVAALLAAAGLPVWVAALGAILSGAAMGAANGALIAWLKLPSIVVTLATMVMLRGALLWQSQGAAVHLPDGFQWFGRSQRGGETLIVLIALLALAGFACALRWVAMGRTIYAVGADEEAARLAGIRPKRVVLAVFVLMGSLTGLAALLNAVRFVMVYPNAGDGLELQVIAAVVVGGTAISGGRGNLLGTLIGVAVMGTIGSFLVFLHTQPQWEKAIEGMIILIAVASDRVVSEVARTVNDNQV